MLLPYTTFCSVVGCPVLSDFTFCHLSVVVCTFSCIASLCSPSVLPLLEFPKKFWMVISFCTNVKQSAEQYSIYRHKKWLLYMKTFRKFRMCQYLGTLLYFMNWSPFALQQRFSLAEDRYSHTVWGVMAAVHCKSLCGGYLCISVAACSSAVHRLISLSLRPVLIILLMHVEI